MSLSWVLISCPSPFLSLFTFGFGRLMMLHFIRISSALFTGLNDSKCSFFGFYLSVGSCFAKSRWSRVIESERSNTSIGGLLYSIGRVQFFRFSHLGFLQVQIRQRLGHVSLIHQGNYLKVGGALILPGRLLYISFAALKCVF